MRPALRSLTPGPSPGGRGGTWLGEIAEGCPLLSCTGEDMHSAPYRLRPLRQAPPLPPGEGPGVRLRRAGPCNRQGPFVCALVVLLLLLSLTVSLPAQPRRSRESELAALRAEIARLSERLEVARRAQTGIQGELQTVDVELQLQETRLAEAVAARDLAARRVAAGEADVHRLEGELATARVDLRRRLGGLYQLGRQGYLRLFLSLKPDRRLLPSVRLLRYLARRDRAAIDHYQQARTDLDRERERLVARRQETEQWIRNEQARRGQLVAVREHKQQLLARVVKEGQTLAARATELENREKKLAAFLD